MAACSRAIDGGLDLAVKQVVDAEPAWFVEFDEAPSKVLSHHWSKTPNFGDVTKVDWAEMPKVDILTGGYPCQPFSQAGRRKGTHDERHLWPHVLAAIRVLRPRFAFMENVAGHLTLGFDTVLADLAKIGFDAKWETLRASDIGAPHHRERLFILAYPHGQRPQAEQFPCGQTAEVPRDYDYLRLLAKAALTGDLARELEAWWGSRWPVILRWSLLHGEPPPLIDEQVSTPIHPRFPEIREGTSPEFIEWMMGLPEGWVTGVPGLTRNQQIKMLGNGVCPLQAATALKELIG